MADAVATPTRLVTSLARASYPSVFSPRAVKEGDKPRYSLAIMIPPESVLKTMPDADKLIADRARFLKELNAAIPYATKKKFGDNPPPNLRKSIYKAEEVGKGECYEPGWICLRAAAPADKKPTVLLATKDPQTQKWLPCPQEDFYAGCWMRASIDIYGYAQPMSKGIAVGLNFVQKLKDGDRLDSRAVAEDEFDDMDFGGAAAGGQSSADALFG
jgi:hypothetical protein